MNIEEDKTRRNKPDLRQIEQKNVKNGTGIVMINDHPECTLSLESVYSSRASNSFITAPCPSEAAQFSGHSHPASARQCRLASATTSPLPDALQRHINPINSRRLRVTCV